MKRIWPKLVILAILCSPIPSWAGNSAVPSIGTGAQGYTVAPRLARQRALYIESQPRGYAAHVRDNPLSKQYMWSAAANLDTDACGISRIILPRCHRDPPMMDVGCSWNGDKRFTSREFRKPISWHASPATARPARVCARFRVSEECPISTLSHPLIF
jgi:hypothetical protein